MPTVCRNSNGGWYECGKSYSQAKWISTLHQYEVLLNRYGKCSIRQLAKEASISVYSAHRAVKLYKKGKQEMPQCQKGHGRKGIGSKKSTVHIGEVEKLLNTHHTAVHTKYWLRNCDKKVHTDPRVHKSPSNSACG